MTEKCCGTCKHNWPVDNYRGSCGHPSIDALDKIFPFVVNVEISGTWKNQQHNCQLYQPKDEQT